MTAAVTVNVKNVAPATTNDLNGRISFANTASVRMSRGEAPQEPKPGKGVRPKRKVLKNKIIRRRYNI